MIFEYVVEGYSGMSYFLMADTLKEFYGRLLKQFNLRPSDVRILGKITPEGNGIVLMSEKEESE